MILKSTKKEKNSCVFCMALRTDSTTILDGSNTKADSYTLAFVPPT